MRLSQLRPNRADATAGAADPDIAGLTADSRAVRPGFVFAALPGVKADGRAFMEKFGKLGDILDKRAQREFAAILLPGVFRRFGEKAEAAERARAK